MFFAVFLFALFSHVLSLSLSEIPHSTLCQTSLEPVSRVNPDFPPSVKSNCDSSPIGSGFLNGTCRVVRGSYHAFLKYSVPEFLSLHKHVSGSTRELCYLPYDALSSVIAYDKAKDHARPFGYQSKVIDSGSYFRSDSLVCVRVVCEEFNVFRFPSNVKIQSFTSGFKPLVSDAYQALAGSVIARLALTLNHTSSPLNPDYTTYPDPKYIFSSKRKTIIALSWAMSSSTPPLLTDYFENHEITEIGFKDRSLRTKFSYANLRLNLHTWTLPLYVFLYFPTLSVFSFLDRFFMSDL